MGGMHGEQDGPGYQPAGGRGFGYNRGGFRGRGFPVRPGMGRGFEHGHPPGDMGRGGPWMGKEGMALLYIPMFFSRIDLLLIYYTVTVLLFSDQDKA